MTLLYDAQLPADRPQLHVMVVGVNDYAHLPGGRLAGQQPAPKNFGLGVLTSPVVSATGIADWLLSSHHNPSAPLGSVELLLAPASYTPSAAAAAKIRVAPGAVIPVEEATLANMKAAAARWFLRAHRHRDNITLFYYCGHGLEASDRYLLPADFGANPLDWTDNIVNFTATYGNMGRCRAKTQYYFVDACRDRPSEVQAQAAMGSIGQALIGPQSGSVLERDAPIYHAAAPGQSAVGPPGQRSFFTRALLDCLNGLGARQPGSAQTHTPIDHVSLGPALRELVDRLGDDQGLALRCAVSGEVNLPQPVDLHLAPVPIQVLATILCQPAAAHRMAHLSVEDSTGQQIARDRFEDDPWRLTVTAGRCTVKAHFDPDAPFANLEREEIAFPPLFQPRPPLQIPARPDGGS